MKKPATCFDEFKIGDKIKFKNAFGKTVLGIKVGTVLIKKSDQSVWNTGQFHKVVKWNLWDYIKFYTRR